MASKSNASGGRGAAIGTGDDSPSDVGGYSTELFVELPPKDLICNKCEKVLRDPRQTECGHLYCAQCIAASVGSPTVKSRDFICNVTSRVGNYGGKVGEDGRRRNRHCAHLLTLNMKR